MNNNRKLKIKKMMKKGATISLCAVLAGGIGVGAYEGVDYFTGAQSVQAATDSSEKLTLMKSDKKSDKSTEDTTDTKSSDTKGSLDVSEVAEEAMPSVVAITTKSVQEVQNYYSMFGSQYAPSQEQEVQGSGSGIIIGKTDSELLIATNYHVVDGADTLSVAFADGSAYEATVKGFDENEDLAVVSVATKDVSNDTMDAISVAKIGSSDDLKIGEQVVAIGNALGYGQSVTTGIVSAKNRKTDSSGQIESSDSTDNSSSINKGVNLIQTDAAINPGNSGGALLNMDGEVVGINSSKLASTEVEGMGYAIAISDVADSLENMMNAKARDKVDNHGILGITGSTVSDEAVQIYGIPQGVFVSEVTEGGPADDAGITKNMVITEFDGKTITSIDQLVELLQYYEPKEKIDVTVAVLDTGLAPHPDFKSRVVGWRDCIYRKEKCYDDNGHGTHVAGILGGSGQMSGGILSGIAPLCRFVIVKVLDQKGEANVASILAGLKWVEMSHRKYKIRIVNLSAGAGENLEPGKEKMLIEAVEHLWDLGLVVVVSSGNNGLGEGTIAIPGNSRKVITVGAVKTEKAEKGSCSGAGPTKECVVKPDVIAPGYQIISCNSQIHGKKDAYTVKSGSSMATPVVSGAVALLMEKYPRITNVEVKLRLRETCIHLPGAGEQGWGMLNIRDFLKL